MVDLILPGLNGSGPGHWQQWWLTAGRPSILVQQDDWANPRLEAWMARLASAASAAPGAILVAHSLACATVAQAVARQPELPIGAALLVAPADVDDASWATPAIGGFGPVPLIPFPFPTVVVASRNDPYVALRRAFQFASAWGAEIVDIGDKGHINGAAGYGPWPEGLAIARRLSARLARAA